MRKHFFFFSLFSSQTDINRRSKKKTRRVMCREAFSFMKEQETKQKITSTLIIMRHIYYWSLSRTIYISLSPLHDFLVYHKMFFFLFILGMEIMLRSIKSATEGYIDFFRRCLPVFPKTSEPLTLLLSLFSSLNILQKYFMIYQIIILLRQS